MTTIDGATGKPIADPPEPGLSQNADNVVQMPGTKRVRERVKRKVAEAAETIRAQGLAAANAADAAVSEANAAVNEAVNAGAHAINAGAQAFNAVGDLGKWILLAAVAWIVFAHVADDNDGDDEK